MKKLPAWIFLFFVSQTSAQSINMGQNGAVVDSALKEFVSEHKDLLPIYNGRLFYAYASTIQGHAFFNSNEWEVGSIEYDGVWYQDIVMLYDLVKDVVIVKHPNGIAITLVNDRVKQFRLPSGYFVRMNADKDKVIRPGFYQRLSNGDVTLYARRAKFIEEKITGNEIERKFASTNHFYVYTEGTFYQIKKAKNLLPLLKENKQKVTQYMSTQPVSLKKEPERAMLMIAEYNNQLH